MKTFYLLILTSLIALPLSVFGNETTKDTSDIELTVYDDTLSMSDSSTENDTAEKTSNSGNNTDNAVESNDINNTDSTTANATTSDNEGSSIGSTDDSTQTNTPLDTSTESVSGTIDTTTVGNDTDVEPTEQDSTKVILNEAKPDSTHADVLENNSSTPNTPTDISLVIFNKRDIKKLKKLAFLPKELDGTFVLQREGLSNGEGFTYTLKINNTKKWGITAAAANPQIEEIISSNQKETTEEKKPVSKKEKKRKSGEKEWHRKSNSNLPQKYGLEYHHTPWTKLKPFWRTDTMPRGLLSWFQWETGGSIELRRDHFFNFLREGDTIDDPIDLMKPSLVGYNLEMSYRHKIKFFYVGGGFTRHSQDSKAFDTLFTDNENWMRRLGWQLHVAVPGFKYEIYRDPRLIPEYGCHDRKVFDNLVEDNAFKHEFLYKVHVYESKDTLGWNVDTFVVPIDTLYNGKYYKKGDLILDSTALTRGIWIPPGIGHKLSVKVGHFNYTLLLDPYRYRGPVQTYLLKDLPFFKADWDMGIIVLPNGRVIPTGAVDFYTFKIPIKGHALSVTPLRFTFQIASRREFYMGLSFRSEFKPNFSKRKKERSQ